MKTKQQLESEFVALRTQVQEDTKAWESLYRPSWVSRVVEVVAWVIALQALLFYGLGLWCLVKH